MSAKYYGKDYLSVERYPAHWEDTLRVIRGIIENSLKDDPTFGGVSFCDVSAGYIQVNMIHADEPNYVHRIHQLAYDMDNSAKVTIEAISAWRAQSQVAPSDFYRHGEKYGWD